MSALRLHGIRAENFKRLSAVDIRFSEDEHATYLSGRNEQGKSSAIDAVWAAIGGKAEAPIRKGEDEAIVEIDLGELTVRRRWYLGKRGKSAGELQSELEVRAKDGSKLASPQAVLDALLGPIAFDPMAWIKRGRDPAGQRAQAADLLRAFRLQAPQEALQALLAEHGLTAAPAGDDPLGPYRVAEAALVEARAEAGKARDREQAAAQTLARGLPPDAPTEPVDFGDLQARLEIARRSKRERDALVLDITNRQGRIEALERELAEARRSLAKCEGALAKAEPHADVEALEGELGQAAERNEFVRRGREAAAARSRATMAQARWDRLDAARESVRELLAGSLRGLDLPGGLELGENGLLLDGLPFPGSASGEQQITLAVALAAKANPRLRLVRIEDGNRLDASHRRALEAMLERTDMQALVELVDDSGQVGVVIGDGRVQADHRP